MKNLKFITTILIIIFIGCLAHIENVTRRYNLYEDKTLLIENARLINETDTQITVLTDKGIQVTFSKNNLTIVRN